MNFDEIINKINVDLNNPSEKIKLDLIYAFNGTGKTRISRFLLKIIVIDVCALILYFKMNLYGIIMTLF